MDCHINWIFIIRDLLVMGCIDYCQNEEALLLYYQPPLFFCFLYFRIFSSYRIKMRQLYSNSSPYTPSRIKQFIRYIYNKCFRNISLNKINHHPICKFYFVFLCTVKLSWQACRKKTHKAGFYNRKTYGFTCIFNAGPNVWLWYGNTTTMDVLFFIFTSFFF
jgi:hypothetical protein